MKRITVLLAAAIVLTSWSIGTASAAEYRSCTQLRAEFPNGIARTSAAADLAVHHHFRRPEVRPRIYTKFVVLDAGRNGYLCTVRH